MILSFEKKVRGRPYGIYGYRIQTDNISWIVCVSDTLIAEIKRIIKSSEIMKYKKFIQGVGKAKLTMIQGE